MIEPSFMDSLKKARTYGLGEFLEIIGELSQESTKKGIIDRKHKELITLGIALAKGCHRCIEIHTDAALKYGSTPEEVFEVMPIALLMDGAPALSQIPHLVAALEQVQECVAQAA
jgi:AhpD family alkylhydroperoxidase